MKILALSDTHNKHMLIPSKYIDNIGGDIDMVIHSGDVSSRGSKDEIRIFLNWFSKLPYKYKIFIAGNHDFFFEQAPEYEIDALLAEYPEVIYLNDSEVIIEGLKIWGSPVTPYFHNWAFNRIGDAICKHWDLISLDTHILVTHGPMLGYLDKTLEGKITGCPYLLEKIRELKNLIFFQFGHIHEAYGDYRFANDVWLINASVLNRSYDMRNKPYVITIDNETNKIINVENEKS